MEHRISLGCRASTLQSNEMTMFSSVQQLAIKFPFAPRIVRVRFSLGLRVLAGLSVLPVRRYWELGQPFSKQFIGVYC
jgi:hypothetical protein